MKKSELINEIAINCGISKGKAKEIIDTMTTIITDKLSSGEKVNIDRLGCFQSVKYGERTIKAVTGEIMQLEERLTPRFTASQTLKNKIRCS